MGVNQDYSMVYEYFKKAVELRYEEVNENIKNLPNQSCIIE